MDLTELAEQLRAVLALVDGGELRAEVDQREFLRGALFVAESLADPGCLNTKTVRPDGG